MRSDARRTRCTWHRFRRPSVFLDERGDEVDAGVAVAGQVGQPFGEQTVDVVGAELMQALPDGGRGGAGPVGELLQSGAAVLGEGLGEPVFLGGRPGAGARAYDGVGVSYGVGLAGGEQGQARAAGSCCARGSGETHRWAFRSSAVGLRGGDGGAAGDSFLVGRPGRFFGEPDSPPEREP